MVEHRTTTDMQNESVQLARQGTALKSHLYMPGESKRFPTFENFRKCESSKDFIFSFIVFHEKADSI